MRDDGLARGRLDEGLHTASETKDRMKSGLLLDAIV